MAGIEVDVRPTAARGARTETDLGTEPEHSTARVSGHILTLGALLVIAAGVAMRLYLLGTHPAGLWFDEAEYGLDALRVIDGAHPIYFPANFGREPLFIYLMSLTIRLFGRNPLGIRAAAALCGVLTLPAAYFLGRAWANHRVGLLSAALLAGTLWHVHLSHIGFRVVMLPLFLALALGLGALALKSRSRRLLIAAGVVYGLTFYTYLAARFTPLAVLAMVAYGVIWHRDRVRGRWRDGAWIAAATLLTVLPLAIYAARHPHIFFARSETVAIWNVAPVQAKATGGLAGSALHTLGMFTWRGDSNWRHNVPHRPIFDPLVSLAFLAGVGMAVMGWRRRPAWALSLIWTVVMSVPTAMAGEAPHFLRSVGILPVVLLLPALALDEGLRWRSRRPVIAEAARLGGTRRAGFRCRVGILSPLGVVLLLFGSAALSAWDYFGTLGRPRLPLSGFNYTGAYRTDPLLRNFFFSPCTDLARDIDAAPSPVYLDRKFWDKYSTVRFLVQHSDRLSLYHTGDRLTPGKMPFTLIAWPYEKLPQALHALPPATQITVAEGAELPAVMGYPPVVLYVSWTAEPLAHPAGEGAAPLARYACGIDLLDAHTSRTGNHIALRLCWRRSQPVSNRVQLVVEAVDAAGNVVSQHNDTAGTFFYPPSLWSPGSDIIQHAELDLPSDMPAPRLLRMRLFNPDRSAELAIAETRARQDDNTLILPLDGSGT